MAERTGRQRGTSKPGEERDLQTEIEDELRTSGRSHIVPREGLFGAHERRREGLGSNPERGQEEPLGRGADVAPTRKAEVREAARHELERQAGHLAAGEAQGVVRQRRSSYATREALDGIAAEADELVARWRLTAEGDALPWYRRALAWLQTNRTPLAAGVAAALLFMGVVKLARRHG